MNAGEIADIPDLDGDGPHEAVLAVTMPAMKLYAPIQLNFNTNTFRTFT